MHICQFNYRSISNNCKGSNHWNIIRHMNKCIENQGPSHLLNIGIYSFSYLKQTHSKWNLQSSQTRSVGAWQCLASGQHGPKHHFQINSLTCWRIETQSQLLHSVHHIFWVVLILTTGNTHLGLPFLSCSFPEHQSLVGKYAKQVLSITTCG